MTKITSLNVEEDGLFILRIKDLRSSNEIMISFVLVLTCRNGPRKITD